MFKTTLAKDAGLIMSGETILAAAKKTWEDRKNKLPRKSTKDEVAKWNDKKHQKAEWNRFKQHQVFYLGGNIGIVNKAMVSLVQFNK